MPMILEREVGQVGYGMMPLHWPTTAPSEDKCFEVLRSCISQGCTVWNAGEHYGKPGNNSLTLLNSYFAKYPDDAEKITLIVKGAFENRKADGTPEGIRRSVDNCQRQLGDIAKINVFEPARRDMETPLEETMTTLDALVKEGKIGGVALGEVNAQTIRTCAKVTRIAAVEVELSLWLRDPLYNGITDACSELGIPILAYCPLGRGMLTGRFQSLDDLPEGDPRRMFPRFEAQNFENNIKLVEALEQIAKSKSCTLAQLALGWLCTLSKAPVMSDIIPIPGTSNPERVKENAAFAKLSDQNMQDIDALLSKHKIAGERYPEAFMKQTNL